LQLTLHVLPEAFGVCRLDAAAAVPGWAAAGTFSSVTRTADELSVVCEERLVPEGVKQDGGWRCLKLVGPFDLELTGVLASVLQPLAGAGVSIFAVSTFDTDYVLVRNARLEQAVAALRAAGHQVVG
jgi:hypothetical protein